MQPTNKFLPLKGQAGQHKPVVCLPLKPAPASAAVFILQALAVLAFIIALLFACAVYA